MADNKRICGLFGVVLGLILTVTLVWFASPEPVRASPGLQCVNETGTHCDPACDECHAIVQKAVDHALSGDEIRIAGGAYTQPIGTLAHIEKELWITGGYDPTCTDHDPELHETVLDAQGLATAVEIVDAGDVGLMHLTIVGGDGTGNCGDTGCGGGIYVENSTLHLGHSLLTQNVANTGTGEGRGGGLYATGSAVEVWESQIVSNTAQINPAGDKGYGGGIYVEYGAASLHNNLVLDNLACVPDNGYGGGIYLGYLTHADVLTNVLEANRSNPTTSFYGSYGGGLYVRNSDAVSVAGNTVLGNFTNSSGGGIGIRSSQVHVTRNRIMGNNSTGGGGIKVEGPDVVTLTNNLIVQNVVDYKGGGLYASHNASTGARVVLVNNTIADNALSAIATRDYATLTMTNNVLTGHELGIDETDPLSSTVSADTNLFLNEVDPIVGANPIEEDPLYGPDYHLLSGSPALDAGLPVPWLTVDLDGDPRPQNEVWDVGAYEGPWKWPVFLPLVLRNYAAPLTPIFDDDFDDGTLAGWTANQGTWTNPGDHMRGEYALGNAWNVRTSTGSDVVYEGTVNLMSGNAAGLTFRSSADGTSSYDVILDAHDNVFKLSKRQPYTVLQSHSMTVQHNHSYKIKVMANGNTLDAYLDGVKLLTATDGTYSTGHLGVVLFQATAKYDDLVAWELP